MNWLDPYPTDFDQGTTKTYSVVLSVSKKIIRAGSQGKTTRSD